MNLITNKKIITRFLVSVFFPLLTIQCSSEKSSGSNSKWSGYGSELFYDTYSVNTEYYGTKTEGRKALIERLDSILYGDECKVSKAIYTGFDIDDDYDFWWEYDVYIRCKEL